MRRKIIDLLRFILIGITLALVTVLSIGPFRETFFYNLTRPFDNNALPETNNTTNQGSNTGNSPKINSFSNSNKEIEIIMSPEKELSGLTKEEILNIRREEMRTSPVFSGMNYSPDSYVYQIDDGLPWISKYGQIHWSTATEEEKTKGVSRDSLGIMNPELLYFVSPIDYYKKDEEEGNWRYLYNTFNFLPYKVTYTPNNETITAYIKNKRNESGNYFPIALSDSNAHDLGYHYAYMDFSHNIGFYREHGDNTLKNDIKDVTGYFMHGSACGIPGGCNNYAPYWQYYNHFYLKDLPASFNIKLWKNKPSSPEDKAYINFKMIFE